ncbi:MAG: wax ester/triacylglycerol synthase family O-acyltransferase [Actinomycetota bacterium]|nr:wax ester/triacylglycerol synthase family O-acyltransferase [Actinomycetota bacterium]
MDWDQLQQTGTAWRIRVQLADHPGQLAALATRLSDHGCNLLGVSVLPVAGDPSDPAGDVVDELVLRAPVALQRGELSGLVEVPGARCVGISPASVGDLVDTPTAVLRTAAGVLSGLGTPADALAQVLGADSVTVQPRAAGTHGAEPGSIRLTAHGHRATITLHGGEQAVALREWAPFTDGELARVPALLVLLAFVERRTPSDPDVVPSLAQIDAPPRRPRRQLSSLDTQFLNAETSTTLTHVGGLTILDPTHAPGGPLTVDGLRALIGSRLHLVAPLRWRLHAVPLGLDLPYWVDTGTVELSHHIREVHLPAPGTDVQLGEQIGRLAQTPLSRERPLWECYLVHGLAGGRQALYTKVHHAMIDGVSAAEVLAMVLDLEPQPPGSPAPDVALSAERAPGLAEMLRRGVRRSATLPLQLVRSAPTMLPHALELPGAANAPGARQVGAMAAGLGRLAGRSPQPALPQRPSRAPMTPFNGPVTARRGLAFAALPLDEVKAVKNALGFTVNDVVMALCTTALRRWLVDHDALPECPLVAAIPVSVRTAQQFGSGGNQISFMLTALPTDEADPARRLEVLHTSLAAAKERFRATPARLLHEFSAVLPQAMHGLASRTVLRAATLSGPAFNLFVSNVAGPQIPLYAAGARVTGNFPVSVVSDLGGGINITVMSYDGHLDFGIVVCPDMVPDVWDITRHLRDALTELTAVARPGQMPESTDGCPQPARTAGSLRRTLVTQEDR